jgi:hypothetical protein
MGKTLSLLLLVILVMKITKIRTVCTQHQLFTKKKNIATYIEHQQYGNLNDKSTCSWQTVQNLIKMKKTK